MEEGVIKYKKDCYGGWLIYSDCISGKMEYAGRVDKVDRPMFGKRWHAVWPNGKSGPFFETRKDCAEYLARA